MSGSHAIPFGPPARLVFGVHRLCGGCRGTGWQTWVPDDGWRPATAKQCRAAASGLPSAKATQPCHACGGSGVRS